MRCKNQMICLVLRLEQLKYFFRYAHPGELTSIVVNVIPHHSSHFWLITCLVENIPKYLDELRFFSLHHPNKCFP